MSSGLQGSYNALSYKHGIRIPHGAVIVFSLWYSFILTQIFVHILTCLTSSAQIMYGFLLRPDTLPHSYVSWYVPILKAAKIGSSDSPHPSSRIQSASKVPKRAVKMNRDLVRDGIFDPADIHKLVGRKV